MSSYEARRRTIAGEMNVYLSTQISRLIEEGKITCSLFLSSGGVDSWYRIADPSIEHRSMDAAGVAEHFGLKFERPPSSEKQVSFAGPSGTVYPSSSDLSEDDEKVLEEDFGMFIPKGPKTLTEAKAMVETHSLNVVKKHGVLNQLPADSLSIEDFGRQPYHLYARATCVAARRGEAKIWGTVGNQIDSYGAPNLKEWWKVSSNLDKIKVLSTTKHLNYKKLSYKEANLMSKMRCPF